MRRRLIAPLLALAATTAHADTSFDAMVAASRKDCAKAASGYPAPDQSPPVDAHCDAKDAYYGIGEPVDDVKARRCAYATHDYDVLAMIYANGRGVPRNLAVARKAVCDVETPAPAETSGRLAHLAKIEADPDGPSSRYDFCDDITSGQMEGLCVRIGTLLAQQKRDHGVAAMQASWTPPQKAALAALQRQVETFANARDGEVDVSGSGRDAFLFEAEDEVRKQAADLLARVAAGKLADVPPAQAKAVDDRLNAAWKKLRAVPESHLGTIKQADLLVVQRAWLRYRDAWVAFGKQRYPAVTPATWIATLTEARVKQLKELAGEAD